MNIRDVNMHEIIRELQQIAAQEIPAVLCIVTHTSGSTPRKAGAKMLVFADGSIKGTIGGGSIEYQAIQEAMNMTGSDTPLLKTFNLENDLQMHCGGAMQIYFEAIGSQPNLYIFGGGHIGQALAGYAAGLGFAPLVIDQRNEIFASWNLQGVRTLAGDYLQTVETLPFSENTYVVIVTPKHEFDEKVLHACLPLPHAYIGMIGSKRKVAEVRDNAVKLHGFLAESLESVDMPIGIPFAAETPAEIAISIMAKLIDVKNSRKKA